MPRRALLPELPERSMLWNQPSAVACVKFEPIRCTRAHLEPDRQQRSVVGAAQRAAAALESVPRLHQLPLARQHVCLRCSRRQCASTQSISSRCRKASEQRSASWVRCCAASQQCLVTVLPAHPPTMHARSVTSSSRLHLPVVRCRPTHTHQLHHGCMAIQPRHASQHGPDNLRQDHVGCHLHVGSEAR
jgi:hypothetical protein